MYTKEQLEHYLSFANVKAFQKVIRVGESNLTEDAYRMLFGKNKYFDDFRDHPRIRTYETYDGQFIKNGKIDYTTAAGAYQITETTWNGTVRKYPFLTDFSPHNQDLACVALIIGRGALEDLLKGEFEVVLTKCAREWASLPGSPYGQPTLKLQTALQVFRANGGKLRSEMETELPAEAQLIEVPEPTREDIEYNQEPAPVEDKSIQAEREDQDMWPLLPVIISGLAQYVPDIIRLFGNGRVTERNAVVAEKVLDVAKQVTGAINGEDVLTRLSQNPALAENLRMAVRASMDEWLGMITRLHELDEASREKARAFATQDKKIVFWNLSFIEILSLLFVILTFAGGIAVFVVGNISAELKAAIITAMIIGGWTGVKEFWFGSSLGSMQKNPPKEVR